MLFYPVLGPTIWILWLGFMAKQSMEERQKYTEFWVHPRHPSDFTISQQDFGLNVFFCSINPLYGTG